MAPRRMCAVLALVGLLALGMAFIAPNLSALISGRGRSRRAGTALGAKNAANILGEPSGPLVGGAHFVWQMNAPYAQRRSAGRHRASGRVERTDRAARRDPRVMRRGRFTFSRRVSPTLNRTRRRPVESQATK